MSPARPAGEAIPVVVIGGYLGAGKTTLVNHLLRQAQGRRIAVLVNDFGEISIDADLIEGAEGGVLSLAGGCVCCDFGADLVGTLETLRDRDPAPDIMVIETSGVGLPGAVARSVGLAQGLAAVGVVVVVDAETVRVRAADRYVGDTVRRQLADADLLVAAKGDLAGPVGVAAVTAWLADAAQGAPVIAADHGRAPADLVLGPRPGGTGVGVGGAPGPHAHFDTGVRRFDGPVDLAALAGELTAPGSPVVRAKGVLTDLDGVRKVLQTVGRRSAITSCAAAPEPPPAGGELVWIAPRADG